MAKHLTLKEAMGADRARTLNGQPTLHSNCIALFGVARPGKTRRDKEAGNQRFQPNRRFPGKK